MKKDKMLRGKRYRSRITAWFTAAMLLAGSISVPAEASVRRESAEQAAAVDAEVPAAISSTDHATDSAAAVDAEVPAAISSTDYAADSAGTAAEEDEGEAEVVIIPIEEEFILPPEPEEPFSEEETESRESAEEEMPDDQASSAESAEEDHTAEASENRALQNALPVTEAVEQGSSLPSVYPAGITATNLTALTGIYPDVRNQGSYSCCWAFSANATAELYLLNHGDVDRTVDFSELATAYSVFNVVEDPLGGLSGDSNEIISEDGNNFLTLGGNSWWAMRAFFQWQGLCEESEIPYSLAETVLEEGIENEKLLDASAHITSAVQIDVVDEPELVKEAIMENGAVAGSYYTSKNYYNTATNAYYCDTYAFGTNHGITIIGWDDDFPGESFKTVPKDDDDQVINGAWLARNSWGLNGAGYNGYFWISYADQSFNYSQNSSGVTNSVVYTATYALPGDREWHDHNYQYDGSLASAQFFYGDSIHSFYAANVFTAQKKEELSAVSVNIETGNTDYEVKIYTNLTDPADPESGTLAEEASISGTFDVKGVYQLELAKPVPLEKGTTFSVVVRVESADEAPMICIERSANTKYSPTDTIRFTASIEEGQSFARVYSTWTDCSDEEKVGTGMGNFRIKAFTDDPDESDDPEDPNESWPFLDVSVRPGNWVYEAVRFVWQKGIMSGDKSGDGEEKTVFRPNSAIKRSELVVILWQMEGSPDPVTEESPFRDVQDSSKWYYKPVLWASENGIVAGYEPEEGETLGRFAPSDLIKRQDLAAMLHRYAAFKGYSLEKADSLDGFQDAGRVSAYAEEALLWATGQRVIFGSESGGLYYLNPKNSTSRKETARMIQSFCEAFLSD